MASQLLNLNSRALEVADLALPIPAAPAVAALALPIHAATDFAALALPIPAAPGFRFDPLPIRFGQLLPNNQRSQLVVHVPLAVNPIQLTVPLPSYLPGPHPVPQAPAAADQSADPSKAESNAEHDGESGVALRRSKRSRRANVLFTNYLCSSTAIVDRLPNYFSRKRLPDDVFECILDWLDTVEKVRVRGVCRRWKYQAERLLFKGEPKLYLKLNIVNEADAGQMMLQQANGQKANGQQANSQAFCRIWQPKHSMLRMQFDHIYEEPVIEPHRRATLSIRERHFTPEAVQLLGRLYSKVETLLVYFDVTDKEANIDNLVAFLGKVTRVLTFGMIMSEKVASRETLPKLCTAIESHLAPLERLYLHLPNLNETTADPYTFYPEVQLNLAISYATAFSMTCTPINIVALLCRVGCEHGRKVVCAKRPRSHVNSLGIACRLQDTHIEQIMEQNRELASVTRLQLTCIMKKEDVLALASRFVRLRELQLVYNRPSWETFDFDWARCLNRLTTDHQLEHLTDLTLFNFKLKSQIELGMEGLRRVTTFTKVTFASYDLFYQFQRSTRDFHGMLSSRVDLTKLLDRLKGLFPLVQDLSLLSGDGSLSSLGVEQVERELSGHLRDHMARLQRVKVQLANHSLVGVYRSLPVQRRNFMVELVRLSNLVEADPAMQYAHQLGALFQRYQGYTDYGN